MSMCGGTTAARDADTEVQSLCDQVRGDLENKTGRKFDKYTAKQVATQVVAGTNYFVKVDVGGGEHVHVRIFKPLPGQGDPSTHSYQENKTADDPLEYF